MNNEEADRIIRIKKGQGMMVSRNDKLDMQIIASERQRIAYSTDVNDKIK